jgi:hypothetical protein
VKVKLAEYFKAGVSQVWIISSVTAVLEFYASMRDSRGYTPGERVDCSDIIPGFTFDAQ